MDTLLVADDLTGACDAAVHFAARGLRTMVRLQGHVLPSNPCVLACATETRDAAAPEIRKALSDLAAEIPTPSRLFKKIDSTLRGNVGMEIVAARDAFHCDAAVVCSAFPAMHRAIENGILRAPNL